MTRFGRILTDISAIFSRGRQLGGEREIKMPVQKADGIIGNLRVHENSGEVHFHDDAAQLKVVVPAHVMFNSWQRMTSGQMKKFKYLDVKNATELRMRVVVDKDTLDLRAKIKKLNNITTPTPSANYKSFDAFVSGS